MRLPGLAVLKKRSDFLAAQKGRRIATPGFTLEWRTREPGEADGIRVGFTCSRKVGNAVARNRARRRLREVARLTLPEHGRDGTDYVLVGRRDATATRDFEVLRRELETALDRTRRS